MTKQALSMLVHGYSKVGKSLFAASTPPPRLYLDVESAARFLPMAYMDWDPGGPPPTLDTMHAKGVDTAVVAVDTWEAATLAMDWLKTGQHPFVSVSLDSVSELQSRNVMAIAGNGQVKLQDWGQVLRDVGGYVRGLRDLTFPNKPLQAVVVTAMSREDQQGILRPHLQGQLQSVIPYLLDVTGYLFVDTNAQGQEIRRLLTRRRDKKEAGERVNGRIPALMNLPIISGATVQEVMEKNRTFELILKKVFAEGQPVVATPAKQEPVVAGPVDPDAIITQAQAEAAALAKNEKEAVDA